jgi:hypothetical protein
MQLTYDIINDHTLITLGFSGDPSSSIIIDWGDDSITTTYVNLSHTYAQAGTYQIQISGSNIANFNNKQ